MKLESHRITNIVELVASLNLSPRQIQEVFRILGHVFETSEDNKGRLLWCLALGTIAMAAFKIGHPKMYHLFGSQKCEPEEALKFLKELLVEKNVDWWFTLFLTGGGLVIGEEESEEDVLAKVFKIQEGEQSKRLDNLGQWHSGWGHSSTDRFSQIHKTIEEISQWN